ncbi:MAG TPA: hypothetical protein VJ775_06060 [Sphingomicrobium sp.]|nr:hypothetical protein [Sphingomicrobium sp.]
MAGADYKLCDVCDRKTFYDANVDYDEASMRSWPFEARPVGVGAWAVLCDACAKTHRISIAKAEGV